MEIYAISQQKNHKTKTKRRERAQRMQAEKDIEIVGGGAELLDSGDEDDYETLKRDKAVRPPVRRKRSSQQNTAATKDIQSPILEEDIIDGFAILAFKTYEDLEFAIKLASKRNEKRLSSIAELTELMAEDINKPEKQQGKSKSETKSKSLADESYQKSQGKAYNQSVYAHQDAGTSDDSGRASERLTASSVAQRDAESSRDRLSDASSRCSSGKGYICDSEGDDDKASETGSIVFSNTIGNKQKRDDPENSNSRQNQQQQKDEEMQTNQQQQTTTTTQNSNNKDLGPIPMEIGNNSQQQQAQKGTVLPTNDSTAQNCVPNSTSHILSIENVVADVESAASNNKLKKSPPPPLQVLQAPDAEALNLHHDDKHRSNAGSGGGGEKDSGHHEPFSCKTEPASSQALTHQGPKIFPIPLAPLASASQLLPPQPYAGPLPPSSSSSSMIPNLIEPKVEVMNHVGPPPASAPLPPSSSTSSIPPYRPHFSGFSTFTPYSCTTLSSPQQDCKPPPVLGSIGLNNEKASKDIIIEHNNSTSGSNNNNGYIKNGSPLMSNSSSSNSNNINSISNNGNKVKPMSPRISSPHNKERDFYSSESNSSTTNASGGNPSTSTAPDPASSSSIALTQPKVISAVSWSQMSAIPSSQQMQHQQQESSVPVNATTTTSPFTHIKASPSPLDRPNASNSSSSSIYPRPTPPPQPQTSSASQGASPASTTTSTTTTTTTSSAPLSFSAESLFTSSKTKDQTDMLRRELDTRFLTSAGPYLRQELHHHQHQHTHLHQHHQQIIPAVQPAGTSMFPPPLFKDIPKIGGVDSPFYRTATGMGMPMYPGYPPTLLHPNIGTAAQFVAPTHLASAYMQKKPGRWNAMHVRIAWEIYYHQSKQNPERASHLKSTEMLRPPTHVHAPPTPGGIMRGHEMVQNSYTSSASVLGGRSMFDAALPPSYLGASSHMGLPSPFSRYNPPFASYNSISPYARDPALAAAAAAGAYPALHDPWRSLQRGYLPAATPTASWVHKQENSLEISKRENEERERQLREREERERQRREREEKERQKEREREREEKLKKEQQERERKEKEKREFERREMERERMLQQQRLNESVKQANTTMIHDARSTNLRNGMEGDIRIKEENRKDDDVMMYARGAPSTSLLNAQQHPFLTNKHPSQLMAGPQHMGRSMIGAPGPPMPHFPPPPPNLWPAAGLMDPYRDYRLDAMRYGPMMEVMRVEEEARAKAAYAAHSAAMHYRPKPEPPNFPLLHHRMPTSNVVPNVKPPNPSLMPPVSMDGHKKEDPSSAR